jgi:hypothetical protein
MELKGYIMRIAPVVPQIPKIDKSTLNLLSLFVFNSHLSIYQIFKKIESKDLKKIAYKNVHKKVQKLIVLKLIERVEDHSKFQEIELEKGAKYYKLSEEGIFALFYDSNILANPNYYYFDQTCHGKNKDIQKIPNIFLDYKKEIYRYHKDCNFFKLFLHPWICIDTILNLNEDTLDKIRIFLTDCCNIIKYYILSSPKGIFHLSVESNNILISDTVTESLDEFDFTTLNEGNNMVSDNSIFSFLNLFFSFGSETARVKRLDCNHIIVSYTSDSIREVKLIYNEEEKKLYVISIDDDNISKVSLYADSIKKVKLSNSPDYFLNHLDLSSLYYKAVFSLVIENLKNSDMQILKEDSKFKEMLLQVNNKFCSNYNRPINSI